MPTALEDQVRVLSTKIETLSTDVKKLTDLWEAADGMIRIIKWLAIVGAAIATGTAAILTMFKQHP